MTRPQEGFWVRGRSAHLAAMKEQLRAESGALEERVDACDDLEEIERLDAQIQEVRARYDQFRRDADTLLF